MTSNAASPQLEAARQLHEKLAERAASGPHGALQHRHTFSEALTSLLTWDCIRWSRILETTQCAALYGFLGVVCGVGIDRLVARLYPRQGDEELQSWAELWATTAAVLLQVVASAVMVIFIRKVAALVPFFFNLCPSRYLEGYHVQEIEGELAIALAYVGSQTTLLRQLEKINGFTKSKPKAS